MTARVVVAGPYPTMGGAEAAATFDLVRDLVRAGDEVVVVSPIPSAAHHHADPGSPRGAARLAGYSARCGRLVIRLDASALAVSSAAPKLWPARIALALALRQPKTCDVVLDRVPSTVNAKWVSLVLARASSVTVASDEERGALVAAGLPDQRVRVDPSILPPTADRVLDAIGGRGARGATRGTGPADAATIQTMVRERAERSLTPLDAGMGPGQRGFAAKPLRGLAPLERPQIRSKNPAYIAVKRVQLKLLSWMFDSVIQHVNRLQQATIEAVENLDAGPRGDR